MHFYHLPIIKLHPPLPIRIKQDLIMPISRILPLMHHHAPKQIQLRLILLNQLVNFLLNVKNLLLGFLDFLIDEFYFLLEILFWEGFLLEGVLDLGQGDWGELFGEQVVQGWAKVCFLMQDFLYPDG